MGIQLFAKEVRGYAASLAMDQNAVVQRMRNLTAVVFALVILKLVTASALDSCGELFTEDRGEIFVPASWTGLGSNCRIYISVKHGRIKLIFQNISLPPGSLISSPDFLHETGKIESQFRVVYTRRSRTSIGVVLPFKRPNVSDYVGLRILYEKIPKDLCKHSYSSKSAKEIATYLTQSLDNPGYPNDYDVNTTCEYFIESVEENTAVLVSAWIFSLSPADDVTFYDGRNDVILASYNGTSTLIKSVTSRSGAVRVLFRARDKTPSLKRRFSFYYRSIQKDNCMQEYLGKSGHLTSNNKSCTFIIRTSTKRMRLRFGNILIPQNNSIAIYMIPLFLPTKTAFLYPSDSGLVRHFFSDSQRDRFEIRFAADDRFDLKFSRFKSEYQVNLEGTSGTLQSPYYPETFPDRVEITYHVKVPEGHVMLNFTEMVLDSDSRLEVYDGNDSSAPFLVEYRNKSVTSLPRVLASENHLTVVFMSFDDKGKDIFRFKAKFTMETQVKYCKPPSGWTNSYASKNLTLPGRKTKFWCKENYVNQDYYDRDNEGVERVCGDKGVWKTEKGLNCKRVCPPLNDSVKGNSSMYWKVYSIYYPPIHDGMEIVFYCAKWGERLVGPNEITCTSQGNYSASPPICKERPPRDRDNSGVKPWVYGAGAGGAVFIISIVIAVCRVCLGCCTCYTYAKTHEDVQLEPADTAAETEKLTQREA